MARHRRRRVTTYLFKKNAGHYKRFRGNPFKKHIVRGRRALKHNIVAGHYDASGKFHRRNIGGGRFTGKGGEHPGPRGKFFPIRGSPGYSSLALSKSSAEYKRAARGGAKRKTRRKKHSKRRR